MTTATDATRLIALARACATAGVARRALHVALSGLPPEAAQPHHRRLAVAALDPLTAADRAQRFLLPSGDLVVVWRGPGRAALRTSLEALAALLAGTALPQPAALCRLLHLPRDAVRLADLAAEPPPAPTPALTAAPARPLDATMLATLESALAQADLGAFLRRQDVCAFDGNGLRRVGQRVRVAGEELVAAYLPGHAAEAAPWLHAKLRRTFDRRLLARLASPEELAESGPLTLDLAPESLLAPEFLRLDAALPTALRGRITLALHAADILADWAGFRFARDFARARQYRLALHEIPPTLLPVLPLAGLGLDLLELRWPGAAPDAAPPAPTHTVLTGAADRQAIDWARAQGIAFVSGAATRDLDRGNRHRHS